MVYSYNKILQNNEDEPTAATHHNVDQFDNHNVKHKNSHKEVNILCGFMELKLKKQKTKKTTKLKVRIAVILRQRELVTGRDFWGPKMSGS